MKKTNQLLEFMAKACHYAQDHVDDTEAWGNTDMEREKYFQCVSYQMACFFAQNTAWGHHGVESDIVLDALVKRPMKSVVQWKTVLNTIATQLGGWK